LAQSPVPATRFEVASIKPNASNDGSSLTNSDRGTIFIENNTLLAIIRQAYGAREYAIVAPAWLEDERFDITAKFREGATREERRAMMQTLLADRFHLKVHHEEKTIQGFAPKWRRRGRRYSPSRIKAGATRIRARAGSS
jgi:uncharacterized protein (TIGR03435 family)